MRTSRQKFLNLFKGLAVASLICGMAASVEAAPEKRVALVVGNGAYENVPPLANPIADARAVSAALKRLGFEVVEGYDLKNDAMRSALGEFAARLSGANAALVYFAGHGVAVGDENYLLPTDTVLKSESDLDFRTVNVNLVLRQMQREERVNILILDACRDNPFATELARSVAASSKVKSRSVNVNSGLGPIEMQGASGILIAFATDPRSIALDGSGGNSPFTSALLKHMETPGVSLSTVMDRVREDVWNETSKKQKPWVNTSIIGEFMLNPVASKVAALPISGSDTAKNDARPVVGIGLDRAQMDLRMWETAEKANTAEDYQAYLDLNPNGQFAPFARNRIAKLKAAAVSATKNESSDAELKVAGTSKSENAIGLSANARREINMRLRAVGFDPGAISNTFGPASRRAIASWQTSRQFPATGFLTGAQKTTLETQTEEAYQLALATPEKSVQQPVTRNVAPQGRSVAPTRDARRAEKRVAPKRVASEEEAVAVPRKREVVRQAPAQSDSAGVGVGIGTAIGIIGGMRGGGFRMGF